MAYQKLQVGRAVRVYPSDTAEIPFPNLISSGANSTVTTNKLVDATANFITAAIEVGDIVYNTTNGLSTIVTNVDSATILSLSANIFTLTPRNYSIYKAGANNGCVIYVGGSGDIEVTTVGGDRVNFTGILAGQFIPVQVMKVWTTGTNATNILALW
jgi:hypothetical protein